LSALRAGDEDMAISWIPNCAEGYRIDRGTLVRSDFSSLSSLHPFMQLSIKQGRVETMTTEG
jgi:hypothetical protein